jgi:hypothetical protein
MTQQEAPKNTNLVEHYKTTCGLPDPEGVSQRNPQTLSVAITKEKSIAETVGTNPGNKIKEADARLRSGMRPVHSAIVTRTSW